ncbi:ABC transporter substrate-binding protein [Celeribacter sp. PS-C1]|uniref:ABC transporter substrate-binding protein n=1 Tax=Celeribacter sp. PS-C1 TaxID=2820813 RepID=UPI001CA495AE|nr:ABC transporter substrate-binding protein [Celeribacter sp. PS-C1]MBW6416900.1 ABC transporter substrate-binding protein [Celeribacter sp. PS-C1]
MRTKYHTTSLSIPLALSLFAAPAAMAQDMVLGFAGGAGPTGVPAILALESLQEQGLSTEVIEFDSPDILTQALLNGQVQIAVMGPATLFAADLAGADLQMLAKNNQNDYLIIASPEVESCADLDGKTVAYHSTGSTTTAHLLTWLRETCPEAEPNYMVLSGSANRVAALLNGQIDGTLVRLEDWMAITRGEDDRAKVLTMLVESQSDLITGAVVGSAGQIEGSRALIEDFLDELGNQFQNIYADPIAYSSLAVDYLPEMELADVEAVYSHFAETKMFPLSEALSPESIEATLQFYTDAGRIEQGALSVDQVANFTFGGGE